MATPRGPQVGGQIRKLRINRGLSLRALAGRCGMSPNAISLIERGENSPTVYSLHQIAIALNVPIADFFDEEARLKAVLVKNNCGLCYEFEGVELESLGSGLPDKQIEPFHLTIAPESGASDDPISHPGQEFVYCLSGALEYYVDQQAFKLESGDSLLLDASCPHSWRNPNQVPAEIIIVFQTPQEYHLNYQPHFDQ